MGKLGDLVRVGAVVGLLAGCGAARDIKDAADGIKNLEKDQKEIEARLARARDLTYTATYEVKSKDGPTEQLVVAQKPPKSMYRQGDLLLVDDGQRVASCTKEAGKDECVDVGPHTEAGIYGVGAGAGFAFAFNPALFPGLYATAAIVPGVEAGKSNRDIAGQASECLSIKITRGSDKGEGLVGCTTEDGVFSLYDDGEGNTTTMVKFEKSAKDSAFETPVKARTQEDILRDATSTTTPRSTSSSSSSSSSSSTSTTEPDETTTTT